MLTSGMWSRGPGPCPICGAADSACKAADAKEGRSGIQFAGHTFEGPPWAAAFPWRSAERVYGTDMQGMRVLKYGKGAPIPLIEALRQGLVEVSTLNDEQKAGVKKHAERDPEAKAALVKALKEKKAGKPANRMVKQDALVTKGVN